MVRFLSLLIIAFAATPRAHAFFVDGTRWMGPTVTLDLELGAPPSPCIDGSATFDDVVLSAISDWNSHITHLQLKGAGASTAPKAYGDIYNTVFFSRDVYGTAWGFGVMGITLTRSLDDVTVEADILFNNHVAWNSYRGPRRLNTADDWLMDLRRIAVHELGHLYGLGHPDQYGQHVTAQMNAYSSDLDSLTDDDIAGAQAIYDQKPTVVTPPSNLVLRTGTSDYFVVHAFGWTSLQWMKDGAALPGATDWAYTIQHATVKDAGEYTAVLTNPLGTTTASATVTVDGLAAPLPDISVQPQTQWTIAGQGLQLSVAATGNNLTYQWYKDGAAVAGATASSLALSGTKSDAGSYTVSITSRGGSVTSQPAVVTVYDPSKFINLSVRINGGTGDSSLIAGFVISGEAPKTVLVRAVGPTLGLFSLPNFMPDPKLEVRNSKGALLAANNDWDNTQPSIDTAAKVGAFPLNAKSTDAALVVTLVPGAYSAVVPPNDGRSGIVLLEVYEVP